MARRDGLSMDIEEPSVDENAASRMAEAGGKGFAARLLKGRQSSAQSDPAEGDAEETAENDADPRAAERARQALSGMLLMDDGQGSPSIPIDAKAFKDKLERMSESELRRMADFLSAVRAAAPDGAGGNEPPIIRTAEEELNAHGLNLHMSGKNNTVYVSGAGSNWTVTAPVDKGEEEDGGQRKTGDGARRGSRNNWGQTVARPLKAFIRGY